MLSFWGHSNVPRSLAEFLKKIIYEEESPALLMTDYYYPMLNGTVFKECWVFSPDNKDPTPKGAVL